jgi:hypothetical protein
MIRLYIGGIPLSDHAGVTSQQYEPIGGSTLLRMSRGAGKKRQHWQKLKTTISGNGWLPLGLGSLDFSKPLVISCIQPRSLSSPTGRAFELPKARRSDVLPWGLVLMGDDWFDTPVTLEGDIATLAPVEGAIMYQVYYLPLLNVLMDDPTEQLNTQDSTYDWSIEAEEV